MRYAGTSAEAGGGTSIRQCPQPGSSLPVMALNSNYRFTPSFPRRQITE
jgi:hypothetical protein